MLCDRVGILADGQLACLGSPRELVARHGGYTLLTLVLPPSQPEQAAAAEALVRGLAPGARLTYHLAGTCTWEVPCSEAGMAGEVGWVGVVSRAAMPTAAGLLPPA